VFNMKEETDIIISINVHEKPEFLLKQINNINQYVKLKHKIILNCNTYMYNYLTSKNNAFLIENNLNNIVINPEILDKSYNCGLICKGIFKNLKYSFDNFNFKFFIVMSSREFFLNKLEKEEQMFLYDVKLNNERLKSYVDFHKNYEKNDWGYPQIKTTKLFKHVVENNWFIGTSPHEGLAFNKLTALNILNFNDNNNFILEEVFNKHGFSYEEFTLQTLAINLGTFYYIGNHIYTKDIKDCDKNQLTYKKNR